MHPLEALAELGLSPDADGAAVREAYLRLLRVRRPETDPAGFMRLRTAYEAVRGRPVRAASPPVAAVRAPEAEAQEVEAASPTAPAASTTPAAGGAPAAAGTSTHALVAAATPPAGGAPAAPPASAPDLSASPIAAAFSGSPAPPAGPPAGAEGPSAATADDATARPTPGPAGAPVASGPVPVAGASEAEEVAAASTTVPAASTPPAGGAPETRAAAPTLAPEGTSGAAGTATPVPVAPAPGAEGAPGAEPATPPITPTTPPPPRPAPRRFPPPSAPPLDPADAPPSPAHQGILVGWERAAAGDAAPPGTAPGAVHEVLALFAAGDADSARRLGAALEAWLAVHLNETRLFRDGSAVLLARTRQLLALPAEFPDAHRRVLARFIRAGEPWRASLELDLLTMPRADRGRAIALLRKHAPVLYSEVHGKPVATAAPPRASPRIPWWTLLMVCSALVRLVGMLPHTDTSPVPHWTPPAVTAPAAAVHIEPPDPNLEKVRAARVELCRIDAASHLCEAAQRMTRAAFEHDCVKASMEAILVQDAADRSGHAAEASPLAEAMRAALQESCHPGLFPPSTRQ